jgi:uncharacterized membrane protein YeaQ/YmgE (transglycosylase-associated protein family)
LEKSRHDSGPQRWFAAADVWRMAAIRSLACVDRAQEIRVPPNIHRTLVGVVDAVTALVFNCTVGDGRRGRVATWGRNAMSVESLIILIIIGAIAGWLAGVIVKGVGFGLVGNIVVGIVGAFIGTWVLGALGISIGGGTLASIINATIGAVILLFIISLVKRA